jgi:6-phosphogluconolactonase
MSIKKCEITTLGITIKHFKNIDEVSQGFTKLLIVKANDSIKRWGTFAWAISGGISPKSVYKKLTNPKIIAAMPWANTHLFWTDERCVPLHHPESNYENACKEFITKVPIPLENIHRIHGEIEPPEKAAEIYEETLRQYFSCRLDSVFPTAFPTIGTCYPVFDMILLGLGQDGHIASLFPGSSGLYERNKWVLATPEPKSFPPVKRITITLPIINAANEVVFIVSGNGKKKVLNNILNNRLLVKDKYPAANVDPAGNIYWFIDSETVK